VNVLLNAVSIREGGPLVVLSKLLSAMCEARPDIRWHLALNPALAEKWPERDAVGVTAIPIDGSPLQLPLWYERGLTTMAKRTGADVLFSVTNYLPVCGRPCPTVLLEQHAGHFSDAFAQMTVKAFPGARARAAWRLKDMWVRRSVGRADILTVQTAALADAIAATGARDRADIRVIAHGPGWVSPRETPKSLGNGPFRVGYVTKWGVQKNFETLLDAIRLLADAGIPCRLVLTLNTKDPKNAEVLTSAGARGLGALVENHGEIDSDAIEALYDTLDAFAFPSTCESFGMTMVEAMARGLPIAIADTASNREITGDAGHAFAPYDAKGLADILSRFAQDRKAWQAASEQSCMRAHDFSWRKAAQETLAALDAAAGAAR